MLYDKKAVITTFLFLLLNKKYTNEVFTMNKYCTIDINPKKCYNITAKK